MCVNVEGEDWEDGRKSYLFFTRGRIKVKEEKSLYSGKNNKESGKALYKMYVYLISVNTIGSILLIKRRTMSKMIKVCSTFAKPASSEMWALIAKRQNTILAF